MLQVIYMVFICSSIFYSSGTMYELLAAKPEQEQRLLTAIVNKLGDPNRKVASRASYLLGQLGLLMLLQALINQVYCFYCSSELIRFCFACHLY